MLKPPMAPRPPRSASHLVMHITPTRGTQATATSAAPLVIQARFETQAAQRGAHIALRCGQATLTYAELNARANQLARRLRQLHVGPETLVAVGLERSNEWLIAILGILKAGGAYVPLDLAYPAERIRFLLQDAQPAVIITEEKLLHRMPETATHILCLDREAEALASEPADNVARTVDEQNAAYVIYTSGSTGTPKGVVVTHRNVVRLFDSTAPWFHFNGSDVWTLFHSFAFDFSVWEMWGALFYGGQLIIVPQAVSRSPDAFRDLLAREKVTVLNQTPSAFRQLIWADQSSGGAELALRWVICGGEALELQSVRPWFERHGDETPGLVNMYGITETTVHVTCRRIRLTDLAAGRGSVIGEAIPDLSLHILDEQQRPCPDGVAGEIYVSGAGVARGYLRRPELTRIRFLANTLNPETGDRMYRSGDLARRLPDGEIEYLGRADHQVKIRGFRIELGEIEAALNAHPGVRESVVVPSGHKGPDKHLAAYVVSGPERPSVDALRRHLAQTLPDYMLPAQFIFLEGLPLTVNGKVDTGALPVPARLRPDLEVPYAPPSTPAERTLAAIWASVLQLDRVGIHDNFFALGGDSIRSIRVLAEAQTQGFHLSLAQLFETPTIAQLTRATALSSAEDKVPSLARLELLQEHDRSKISPELEDAYPMTRLQLGMVYHSDRDPDSAIFHDVFSYRFRLPWNEALFRRAVAHLAQRHPIYRTGFDLGRYSEPLQLLHRRVLVPVTVEDRRNLTPAAQDAALKEWVEQEKRRPFRWNEPPFLRLHVQRSTAEVFLLIVSFHHAIMDGWSLAAMLTELFQEYTTLLRDKPASFSPPAATYRDFVRLERQALQSDVSRAFWKDKLAQPSIQFLPRWPASQCQGGNEQVRGPELSVPAEVLRGLQGLATSAGAPLRSVLLAAHCRVMSVLSGQTDLLTGLVSNGRPQVLGGERIIGLFLNTLPFRLRLAGGTWQELVADTFAAERELIPHRRCPLSEIQRWSGGQPLFETVFDFVQFHVYQDLPGYGDRAFLEDHYFEANNFTFYQTFMLDASGSELRMHCDYDPNTLCPPQINAIAEYYLNTLTAMAQDPGARYEQHCPLPVAEKERLFLVNRTQKPFPKDLRVDDLIVAQAHRSPEAVAAACDDQQLTYRDLICRAESMAAQLRALGIRPGILVGIHTHRSLAMLVALLAVWRAGAAYVPLDPAFPQARLDFMIQDAALTWILTDATAPPIPSGPDREIVRLRGGSAGLELVRDDQGNAATSPPPTPRVEGALNRAQRPAEQAEPLAYVIYTSGSTGQPKGVQVTHRAVVNFLLSMQEEPGLTLADRLLAVTTLSFDIAVLELFLPLITGGQVVIASLETARDPHALAAALERHEITVMQATPATWQALLQTGWPGNRKLKALCGGEALPRDLANALLSRCNQAWNLYGPTETTVWSCAHQVTEGDGPVPIGRPIANTEVYLLDSTHRQLVPTGTEGEICIAGEGLARGYLNRPLLTAERFPPHPFKPEGRIYPTGDLGRFLPDGTLLCGGRTDHQIKLHGFRIELGEIEAVLSELPGLTGVAAAAREDGEAGKALVAYYVRQPGADLSEAEIRRFLASRLPSYMVPSHLVELKTLPLTPNRKIDRRRLPAPPTTRRDVKTPFVAPRTPLEERVADLWQQVLKIDRISVHDNFFTLGGHSLLAIQVIGRLRRDLQLELSVAALFENPTVETFAMELLRVLLERENGPAAPAAAEAVPTA